MNDSSLTDFSVEDFFLSLTEIKASGGLQKYADEIRSIIGSFTKAKRNVKDPLYCVSRTDVYFAARTLDAFLNLGKFSMVVTSKHNYGKEE